LAADSSTVISMSRLLSTVSWQSSAVMANMPLTTTSMAVQRLNMKSSDSQPAPATMYSRGYTGSSSASAMLRSYLRVLRDCNE
jgi:hypothetical protein